MDNMEIYNAVKSVPDNAKKTIGAGRLKGMTDINPMWRIQMLTEQFGAVGIGWYYKIVRQWTEEGSEGTKCAFVDIELYIKINGEWSAPIEGTGGSMLIAKEKSGLYTSDEAYKMALTDAISVACKALGMGADVYWEGGRTKYNQKPVNPLPQNEPITDKQIKNAKGLLSIHPNKGEVLLKTLLAKYNIKELSELTQDKYTIFIDNVIEQSKPVVAKKIDDSVSEFASKSNQDKETVQGMLEAQMGKPLSSIMVTEYPIYLRKYKEMYDALGVAE